MTSHCFLCLTKKKFISTKPQTVDIERLSAQKNPAINLYFSETVGNFLPNSALKMCAQCSNSEQMIINLLKNDF